jgi:uncharacterized protein (DUF2141 family)
MIALLPPPSPHLSPPRAVLFAAAAAGLLAGAAAPLGAQTYAYARTGTNDLSQCAPGKGPAVRVAVSGLKSSNGNLYARVYPANSNDWLKSKRYVMRIDAVPQQGSMTVCIPLPAPGDYAIAVQHDANGNGKTDFSTDGAGMSNNPGIKKVLGFVPRPPSVNQTRFTAGEGITRMAISIQYM